MLCAWKPTSNTHSPSLPPPTQQHALLLALLLAATINHDHQRRTSMYCSLATKAGVMACRGGVQSGRGKVARVIHFGEGFIWWGAEGGTFGARECKPPERHVDPSHLPVCLVCVSLFVVRTRARAKVFTHKHIHTRRQGWDACCGGRSHRQATRGRGRAVEGVPERSRGGTTRPLVWWQRSLDLPLWPCTITSRIRR